MKRKTITTALFLCFTAMLFAFTTPVQSSVTGKVTPAEGAEAVWIIKDSDSSKAELNNGTFTVNVAPGTYKVVVAAKEPYKNAVVENVEVKEGEATNVGEIVLQQ